MQGRTNKMINIVLVCIYVLCGSFGMVLIRKGGLQCKFHINSEKIDITINWVLLIGVILYVISFLLWIYILQIFPLTYVSPIVYGVVYIMISILSAIFLKEIISIRMIIASFLIIGGVILGSIKV